MFPIVSLCRYRPRGVTKFDPRGMNCTIYIGDYQTLLHTKYRSSVPCIFRAEEFFLVCSHCKSMETIDPRRVAKFDPTGMAGKFL